MREKHVFPPAAPAIGDSFWKRSQLGSATPHPFAAIWVWGQDAAKRHFFSLFPQLDLGIPAMTKCCNQLDICYDTCGANKYRCDAKFRWCLHSICSDLKRSLGFVSKVEGRLPGSHPLWREGTMAGGKDVGREPFPCQKKQKSAAGSSTSVLCLSQVGQTWVRTPRSAPLHTHFCPKTRLLKLFTFGKHYKTRIERK